MTNALATRRPGTNVESVGPRKGPAQRIVDPLATIPLAVVSGIVFAVFATVFFATTAPFSIPHVEALCGASPPDMRPYSTSQDVATFLSSCGADGRAAYRNLQLADLAYPAVVGVFTTSALGLILRHLFPRREQLIGLAAIALIGSAFDYVENLFAWLALASYPDVGASGTMLGLASAAKTVTSWTAGLLLVAGLALLGGRNLRNRNLRRSGRRHPPTLA